MNFNSINHKSLYGPLHNCLLKKLVRHAVLHHEAPPEQVVRGVRAQDLRRGEFPGAADGDIEDVGMASVSTVFSQLSFYYGYFSLQI